MKNKAAKNGNSLNQKLIMVAVVLFVIIAFKYIASDLIAPILLAGMFSVLLMPIFYLYKKRGFSRNISLILMVFTVLLGSVGLISVLQYSFGLIQDSINQAVSKVSNATEDPILMELNSQVSQVITPEMISAFLGRLMASFSSIFLYFIVIPVLAVLLVSQVDSLSEQFKDELSKSGPSLSRYRKFADSMKAYIIGRFKVNLATATMVTLALMILGVEYSLMWGVLALILCFIPYIGIFIAGAGPFLIMLASSGIYGGALIVIVYLVITTITENFIDPLVQGRQNRLTTTSLIIGFIFWSWLFGILGTIISAPLTVMLKSILEDYKETKWIAMLMVGDYSETPRSSRSIKKMVSSYKSKIPGIKRV